MREELSELRFEIRRLEREIERFLYHVQTEPEAMKNEEHSISPEVGEKP